MPYKSDVACLTHNLWYCKECENKNPSAVALGSIKSEKKAISSKENGKKGGRPKSL